MAVRFRSSVFAYRMPPELAQILDVAGAVFQRVAGVDAWVTAIDNGKHGKGGRRTLHGQSYAVDLRTGHTWASPFVKPDVAIRIVLAMKEELGPDFDVILEHDPPHIHAEYDPKRCLV